MHRDSWEYNHMRADRQSNRDNRGVELAAAPLEARWCSRSSDRDSRAGGERWPIAGSAGGRSRLCLLPEAIAPGPCLREAASIEWFPSRAGVSRFLPTEVPRYDAVWSRGSFFANCVAVRSTLIPAARASD